MLPENLKEDIIQPAGMIGIYPIISPITWWIILIGGFLFIGYYLCLYHANKRAYQMFHENLKVQYKQKMTDISFDEYEYSARASYVIRSFLDEMKKEITWIFHTPKEIKNSLHEKYIQEFFSLIEKTEYQEGEVNKSQKEEIYKKSIILIDSYGLYQ